MLFANFNSIYAINIQEIGVCDWTHKCMAFEMGEAIRLHACHISSRAWNMKGAHRAKPLSVEKPKLLVLAS